MTARAIWEPIGHVPPLPRVETAPRYTPPPPSILPEHVQQQMDQLAHQQRLIEGDRIWRIIEQTAKGG